MITNETRIRRALQEEERAKLPQKPPALMSRVHAPGEESNYGQRKVSGAFVRNDLINVPGATRAEKKANLRAMEKQRIVTAKFLQSQKVK